MKTLIAAAAALTLTAPAFAQVDNAEAYIALGNDSAAERVLGETSIGDVTQSQTIGALANESAAERSVEITADTATKAPSDVLSFFAKGNESAAERAARIQ